MWTHVHCSNYVRAQVAKHMARKKLQKIGTFQVVIITQHEMTTAVAGATTEEGRGRVSV